jgi:hypothetical protein
MPHTLLERPAADIADDSSQSSPDELQRANEAAARVAPVYRAHGFTTRPIRLDALRAIAVRELRFQNIGIKKVGNQWKVDDHVVAAFITALRTKEPEIKVLAPAKQLDPPRLPLSIEEALAIRFTGRTSDFCQAKTLARRARIVFEAGQTLLNRYDRRSNPQCEGSEAAKKRRQRAKGAQSRRNDPQPTAILLPLTT